MGNRLLRGAVNICGNRLLRGVINIRGNRLLRGSVNIYLKWSVMSTVPLLRGTYPLSQEEQFSTSKLICYYMIRK